MDGWTGRGGGEAGGRFDSQQRSRFTGGGAPRSTRLWVQSNERLTSMVPLDLLARSNVSSASSAFSSLFSWSGSTVFLFVLFCFAFLYWFEAKHSHVLMSGFGSSWTLPYFFTEEQLTVFCWFVFSLSPLLNVRLWLMWNPCGSGQTGHVTHSQWVGLCGATVISVFLYFQGSRSAINISKYLQHRHEVPLHSVGLSSYFSYW